jgi:peptidoglycan/xylan/chitin deacetylase (PgdA/CDA1 family)
MTVALNKKIKNFLLLVLKFSGAFALVRHLTRRGVRILCYHGAWLGKEGFPGDSMFIAPATFESRMRSLREWGFPVVTLEQATKKLYRGELPPSPVVITIDDGWYSTYCCMLPVLRKYGMDATLYCDTAHLKSKLPVPHVMARYLKTLADAGYLSAGNSGDVRQAALYKAALDPRLTGQEGLQRTRELAAAMSIDLKPFLEARVFDYMDPEQLAEAHGSGLDVQLHTHTHSMHNFESEEFIKDVLENRNQLSAVLGKAPEEFKHFCYPSGEFSRDLRPYFEEIGVVSCTTIEQAVAFKTDDIHFLPRIMDGEHLTALEFEAEMFGVMEVLRALRRAVNFGARG